MTPNEYFDDHIPHRVNLLIAFRQRYSGRHPQITLQQETYRDLFRCAKDISFVMVRFFCMEMGIKFPHSKTLGNDVLETDLPSHASHLGVLKLDKNALQRDPRYADLCDVLRAANRAMAHIVDMDVDHSFKTDSDDERIFRVIDWMEELVKTNIYKAAHRDFAHSMSLRNNVMY